VILDRRLDLRYEGQGYELTVSAENPRGGLRDTATIREAFDEEHDSQFGHRSDEPVEVVTYRLASIIEVSGLDSGSVESSSSSERTDDPTPREHRSVYDLEAEEWRQTPIFDRDALGPGQSVTGPAVVEQLDTTTVVEPGQTATVDCDGNISIEVST